MVKITQTGGRTAPDIVWILDTKKLFVVWTCILLIHSWDWRLAVDGEGRTLECALFPLLLFWDLPEGSGSSLTFCSSRDYFFPLHLFCLLQILMRETSSELSLVLENLPNPWQQGMLSFPPPLASPFVFLAKFLHLSWSKEKLSVVICPLGTPDSVENLADEWIP